MGIADDAIDSAIREVNDARLRVTRKRSAQVRSADEIDYLKAVAYAWFKTHQKALLSHPIVDLSDANRHYTTILNATGRFAARSTYVTALKAAKEALISVRTQLVTAPASADSTSDAAPDFTPLASDEVMRGILVRRWNECQKCTAAGAHLAATVMMGALLEALFVARANRMTDKSTLFAAKSAPRDKGGKAIPLQEWTLQPYIDVSSELAWITKSGKDVAAVLRDYRNYVHPEKERRHGVTLTENDSQMFWEVTKLLARQLLQSAP